MAATEATAAAAAAAEHGSGGLPQFDPTWWPGQMVWMLIIFGVMFFLFAKVFVPKVGGAIADREDRISGDIGDARRLKEAATPRLRPRRPRPSRQGLRPRSWPSTPRPRPTPKPPSARRWKRRSWPPTLAKAEVRIAAARDQAMTHVRDIAADTAASIIEKLTGAAATSDEIHSAAAARPRGRTMELLQEAELWVAVGL